MHGCHGNDFGGGSIIDVWFVAHWVAPNLTSGEGSVTKGFTANDWDRAVRHAVRHNGHTSSLPSEEFLSPAILPPDNLFSAKLSRM